MIYTTAMTALFLTMLLSLQEDKRAEARRLDARAAAAAEEKERHRLLAEAWELRAEAFAEEGRTDDAREAWLKARSYGWSGPLPTGRVREGGTPQDEDHPLGVPKLEIPKPRSMWERFAYQPFPSMRNGLAHALVHLPALEEAVTYPQWTVHARPSIDVSAGGFTRTAQGGTSRWETAELSESLDVDVALWNFLQAGLRVTTGELFSRGRDLVLFQNNVQIMPAGSRTFGVESIVARAKVAFPTSFLDAGVLAEFKVPLAGKSDLLTAKTWDLALSALVSKRFDDWAVHANAGVVFPFGKADLFRDRSNFSTLPLTNDLATVVDFGFGVTWRMFDDFSLGLQFEGNTSPFQNIVVLNEAVYGVVLHGKLWMAEDAYGSLAFGTGFGDLGLDFTATLSFDFLLNRFRTE